jgi:hypothetical protein
MISMIYLINTPLGHLIAHIIFRWDIIQDASARVGFQDINQFI